MSLETTADPILQITPAAAAEVQYLLQKQENVGKVLRFYVEEGGCSGLQYSMTFDEVRADDHVIEMHGVKLVIDPFSSQYLEGTVVDFSDALTGGGWKLQNPNAKQSCGCGKSFMA